MGVVVMVRQAWKSFVFGSRSWNNGSSKRYLRLPLSLAMAGKLMSLFSMLKLRICEKATKFVEIS